MQENIALPNPTEMFCHALAMLYARWVSGERAVHLSPGRMMMRLSPFAHLMASGMTGRGEVFTDDGWLNAPVELRSSRSSALHHKATPFSGSNWSIFSP